MNNIRLNRKAIKKFTELGKMLNISKNQLSNLLINFVQLKVTLLN